MLYLQYQLNNSWEKTHKGRTGGLNTQILTKNDPNIDIMLKYPQF